jgi:DNA-binding XRE family transcriptional regulator
MDDLDRLIEKENQKNPGFRDKVKTRSNEIEIALKLRAAREALKLSQKDIARKHNISLRAISRIENPKDDHVSLYMLNWYASILGFDLKLELISH